TNHIFLLLHVRRRVDLTREHQHTVARRPPPSARRWPNLGRSDHWPALHAVDQRKPGILIGMLPIWLVTTFPIWLVIFIVLYALAALYVAIKFREVRKVSCGSLLCQLRDTLVSVAHKHFNSYCDSAPRDSFHRYARHQRPARHRPFHSIFALLLF